MPQVQSGVQTSHRNLIDVLTDELRFAGAPEAALVPLTMLQESAAREDPSAFHVVGRYGEATQRAFEAHKDALDLTREQYLWLASRCAIS